MIVVKASRIIFAGLGLLPATVFFGKLLNIILRTMYSFFLLAINIPSLAFLLSNLEDMSKATFSSYVLAATTLVISQYWYFAYQQKATNRTFNRLQELVDKSNKL